jgi:D-alanine-D-alanine ligase
MVRGSDRMQVAVLMGGPSSEHDISLLGGKNVVDALDARRYDIRPVVIQRNGAWQVARRPWTGGEGGFDPHAGSGWQAFEGTCEALVHLRALRVEAVLPILHGRFGEDGTLQACLQAAGLPYVGSNARASACAADKVRTKEVLGFHGVATPRFEVLGHDVLRKGLAAACERLVASFGLPLVIKDPLGGSSLEVRVCKDAGQVAAALDQLGPKAERLLVEAFVGGRELTVGVLGLREGDPATALPVIEIRPRTSDTFDYAEKYGADGAEELCPAPLEPQVARQAQEAALRVHHLLGLRAISRTDLMLAPDGRLEVLETNTMPGMTARSLVPRAAAAAGMAFPALVEGLLRTAALA